MRDINSVLVPENPSRESNVLLYPSRMAGQAVTKVVHRCQDANEDQRLDLSDCLLMQVPDAVYHLMRNTILLWINLSSNVIKKIPPKFMFKFTSITELNLSHNQLSSLPDELSELQELKTLDISHNHFVTLPSVIFSLPKLKHLNAEKNFITRVEVEVLKRSPSLMEVNFRLNPLLKSCYEQMKSLNCRISIQLSDLHSQHDSDMELDDIPD
ncbi:hypothetical protein CHUAL_012103 [Chamberlinius hualienensis]